MHQLLRLHPRELSKRAVGRFIAPDPLAGGKHRIAAVAFLVIAVILVAVNDNLVADLPAFDLVTNRPDDAGRIRPGNMEVGAMDIEG